MPPIQTRHSGEPRRVGFELEFSGIELSQAAEALQSVLGAEIISQSAAAFELEAEGLGTFKVEIDWEFLKRKAAENVDGEGAGEWIELLSQAATLIVPLEVVCPPIPLPRLDELEPIVSVLRQKGAVGTEESLVAAYGVHVNAEIPRLDAATIFNYLRAFALLQWWLVDSLSVDITRRIGPHIDLYSNAYLRRLLSRKKATLDEIFDDYLEHNASRNRALDLLPMLAEIDEARVQRAVDDPRVKARPAFHYRLPDCHIERKDWSLQQPWNSWLAVERLANRTGDLDELASAFLDADRSLVGVSRGEWVKNLDQWLKDRELA